MRLREVRVRSAFVKVAYCPCSADLLISKVDVDPGWIESNAGAANGSQNASPVGIGTRECSLHQHGRRNGVRDLPSLGFAACLFDLKANHVLHAFAICHDLLSQ